MVISGYISIMKGSKKKCKMYKLRRKRALESVKDLSPSFKDINKLKPEAKCNTGSGDLLARSHPAKFPICEKELKKSLRQSVVMHAFDPSIQNAEAGRSLSLRPT